MMNNKGDFTGVEYKYYYVDPVICLDKAVMAYNVDDHRLRINYHCPK